MLIILNNHRENSPNRGKGHHHKSVAMRPLAFERSLSMTMCGMNHHHVPGLGYSQIYYFSEKSVWTVVNLS